MDGRKMWVILELTFYILILIPSQMQFWDSSREISNWFGDYTRIPHSRNWSTENKHCKLWRCKWPFFFFLMHSCYKWDQKSFDSGKKKTLISTWIYLFATPQSIHYGLSSAQMLRMRNGRIPGKILFLSTCTSTAQSNPCVWYEMKWKPVGAKKCWFIYQDCDDVFSTLGLWFSVL